MWLNMNQMNLDKKARQVSKDLERKRNTNYYVYPKLQSIVFKTTSVRWIWSFKVLSLDLLLYLLLELLRLLLEIPLLRLDDYEITGKFFLKVFIIFFWFYFIQT